MIRKLLMILSVLLVANAALAETIGTPLPGKDDIGYSHDFVSEDAAGEYLLGRALTKFVYNFELGVGFVGTLNDCDNVRFNADTCDEVAVLSADISGEHTSKRRYLIVVIATTETAGNNFSTLVVKGGWSVGGGGSGGGGADPVYGYIYSDATQTFVAGVPKAVTFNNNNNTLEGVTHVVGSTDIVVVNDGVLRIRAELQVERTSGGPSGTIKAHFTKEGTPIPHSGFEGAMDSAGIVPEGKTIIEVVKAGDVIQFIVEVSNIAIQITDIPGTPDLPSASLTISSFGSTGPAGPAGPPGTGDTFAVVPCTGSTANVAATGGFVSITACALNNTIVVPDMGVIVPGSHRPLVVSNDTANRLLIDATANSGGVTVESGFEPTPGNSSVPAGGTFSVIPTATSTVHLGATGGGEADIVTTGVLLGRTRAHLLDLGYATADVDIETLDSQLLLGGTLVINPGTLCPADAGETNGTFCDVILPAVNVGSFAGVFGREICIVTGGASGASTASIQVAALDRLLIDGTVYGDGVGIEAVNTSVGRSLCLVNHGPPGWISKNGDSAHWQAQ